MTGAMLILLSLLLCLSTLCFHSNNAQLDGGAGKPRSSSLKHNPLTREVMEAIFQQISPGCRSEMEAAMEVRDSTKAEPDISESCKLEIQASAQTVAGSREKPTKVSASASTTKDAPGVDKTKDTTEAIKESDTRKSVILIVVSILGLFGVAIGYIVYVNASQGGGNKKSSKKKEKKAR